MFNRKVFVRVKRNRVEQFVRDRADAMSLLKDRVGSEAFLRFCISAFDEPVSARRDTRRQRLVRAMRRMQERGDLPFVVEGGVFVFDTPCQRAS
jgi:hypothetical protein